MPATVDIVEAFERLLRLVYQNPEQLSTRGPIIERELTYVLLMSPQGAALSQFFSQNTPANRINARFSGSVKTQVNRLILKPLPKCAT